MMRKCNDDLFYLYEFTYKTKKKNVCKLEGAVHHVNF